MNFKTKSKNKMKTPIPQRYRIRELTKNKLLMKRIDEENSSSYFKLATSKVLRLEYLYQKRI